MSLNSKKKKNPTSPKSTHGTAKSSLLTAHVGSNRLSRGIVLHPAVRKRLNLRTGDMLTVTSARHDTAVHRRLECAPGVVPFKDYVYMDDDTCCLLCVQLHDSVVVTLSNETFEQP